MNESAEEISTPAGQLRPFLTVKSLGNNEYKGLNLWKSERMRAVYGGQSMGQALMAASECVSSLDPLFLLQSYHCYFVGPVQATEEVVYKVTVIKEGTNFCSVLVQAIQKEKIRFSCLVSFMKTQAPMRDLDYCLHSMPKVPKPEEAISSLSEIPKEGEFIINITRQVERYRREWKISLPLEMCACADAERFKKLTNRIPVEPTETLWMRPKEGSSFRASENQNYHRAAIAYCSDLTLASLVRRFHPRFNYKGAIVTSLDHSMWFYGPTLSEKWHLYVSELEHCVNGRALNSCRIYREDGKIIAMCRQESLIRPKL